MSRASDRLTGIVLAGGQNRRLGRSKPLMLIGGKLMLARVADTLKPICGELILVVRPDQDDDTPDVGQALGMHVVTDTPPHQGPLAALHAGLATSYTTLCFVTGADHPFLSRRLIMAMANVAASNRSAVVPRVDGVLHPLHSIYMPSEWAPFTGRSLDEGRSSPRNVIEEAMSKGYPPVSVYTEDEIEAQDPQKLSLFDIDTPDNLGIARRIIAAQRPVLRPDIRHGGL